MKTMIATMATMDINSITGPITEAAVSAIGIVGGAVVVGVGVGVIGWIGVCIWSKLLSWEMHRAERKAVEE